MSETLKRIMNHWSEPLSDEADYFDLPFNVEEFCRENDAQIKRLKALVRDAIPEVEIMNETDDWHERAKQEFDDVR